MVTKKDLIIVALATFCLTFSLFMMISPVHAQPGNLWIVPSPPSPTLAFAIGAAGPNDRIHVLAGWFEVLPPLLIWQNNLWIIGPPLNPGPMPQFDLAGATLIIAGSGVFIWGLNFIDSVGAAAPAIVILPGATNCIIRDNIMRGIAPPSTGIQVQGSNNIIAMNTMSWWGTCIDLAGGSSMQNVVVGNTISPNYNFGIQVSDSIGTGMGAGFNQIYWNNVFTSFGPELWDGNPPGSPPNAFDDTFFTLAGMPWGPSGGPSRNKGNFRQSMSPPPIPPMTNGYMDMFPRMVPWTQLRGDINLDGIVDIFDALLFAARFATVWCIFQWYPPADVNSDGIVDIFDALIIAANFGQVDP